MAQQKVVVQFDQERILDELTVDEFIGLQQRDLLQLKSIVGKFIVDAEGNYLPYEKGFIVAGKMSIRQLMNVAGQMGDEVRDSLVPLASEEELDEL